MCSDVPRVPTSRSPRQYSRGVIPHRPTIQGQSQGHCVLESQVEPCSRGKVATGYGHTRRNKKSHGRVSCESRRVHLWEVVQPNGETSSFSSLAYSRENRAQYAKKQVTLVRIVLRTEPNQLFVDGILDNALRTLSTHPSYRPGCAEVTHHRRPTSPPSRSE